MFFRNQKRLPTIRASHLATSEFRNGCQQSEQRIWRDLASHQRKKARRSSTADPNFPEPPAQQTPAFQDRQHRRPQLSSTGRAQRLSAGNSFMESPSLMRPHPFGNFFFSCYLGYTSELSNSLVGAAEKPHTSPSPSLKGLTFKLSSSLTSEAYQSIRLSEANL